MLKNSYATGGKRGLKENNETRLVGNIVIDVNNRSDDEKTMCRD
jgi:hypothetical protein